jgi:replicative DNA helicase
VRPKGKRKVAGSVKINRAWARTLRGQAELIIGKQWNERTGKQKVLFQHEYQRFVEVATPEGIDE